MELDVACGTGSVIATTGDQVGGYDEDRVGLCVGGGMGADGTVITTGTYMGFRSES
jgi:hypothetical protein